MIEDKNKLFPLLLYISGADPGFDQGGGPRS